MLAVPVRRGIAVRNRPSRYIPIDFITTTSRRTYSLRKWYDVLKSTTNTLYTPVFGATTVGETSTTAPWVAPPSGTAGMTTGGSAGGGGGLWRPFLTEDTGRRFFARFSTPHQSILPSSEQHQQSTDWRQSQSEDTYDLDENILELLSMDPDRLPTPCDPLTYSFWDHGMRRQFEPVTVGGGGQRRPQQQQLTFTVCSYNVLCQRTLNLFLEQLYSHCAFEHLSWQRRWPLLAVELRMLDSDIFCLQEVQFDHFEQDYMPFFSKLGYDGTFKKKLKTKSDGCATFWRRDKFRPVHVHPIEYSFPAPHDHSDCVALITVLEPTVTNSSGSTSPSSGRVIVANTHLIYQPALGATKLCQAALLLAHLQKMTRQYSSAPLVLCGDFNSTPYSPLYSLFVDGAVDYSNLNGWSVSGQQRSPSTFRRLSAIGDAPLTSPVLPVGSVCSERCTLVGGDSVGSAVQTSAGGPSDGDSNHAVEEVGRLSHSLNLRSVYDHRTKSGEPEVTMFVRDQSAAVDYIFYSIDGKEIKKTTNPNNRSVDDGGLRCLERYRLPGPTQLNRTIGYLPNQYCASDHLPLMAKFALETP